MLIGYRVSLRTSKGVQTCWVMDRRTAIPKLIETNIRLMKFCLFEEKATAERIWLFLDDDMLVTGLSASLQCKVYQIQKKTFSKVCKNTEISSTENREMSKITWPYGGFIHRASVNYYPADFCQWISLMQWTFEKQVIFRFYSMYQLFRDTVNQTRP